jgi:23S rRNA G2069 N7-methylase RlmK/C1962 C5-methylase RlmI
VRTVYVTVGDISRTGAYVVRRGELEVMADEDVPLEVSDYESNQNVSLQSRVKWVRTKSYNTLVGLVFTEGPLLPGTMLDQYLDRTLMGRGSGPV